MDGSELATLVLTDEPFNVANVGHVTGNPGHREFAMAHGEMSREEFAAFNRAWMSAVMPYLDDGGLLATFIDWRSVDLVIASGLALELASLNLVVWEKRTAGRAVSGVRSTSFCRCSRRASRPTSTTSSSDATAGGGRMSGHIPEARRLGSDCARGPRFPPDGQAARSARGRAPRRDEPRRHRHRLLCRLGLDAVGRGGRRTSLPRCRARRTLLRRHHPPLARDDRARRRPRGQPARLSPRSRRTARAKTRTTRARTAAQDRRSATRTPGAGGLR